MKTAKSKTMMTVGSMYQMRNSRSLWEMRFDKHTNRTRAYPTMDCIRQGHICQLVEVIHNADLATYNTSSVWLKLFTGKMCGYVSMSERYFNNGQWRNDFDLIEPTSESDDDAQDQ